MKAALIPPIPDLPWAGTGDFHLLLSHLLKDRRYMEHYTWQRNKGAYLVLDNSAHEHGEGDDPEALLFNAVAVRAQEVVVPDALDDGPLTVERSTTALESWFEGTSTINRSVIRDLSPSLMYVPQGKTVADWADCLTELMRLHLYVARKYEYKPSFVIGLSKDYEVWDGGLLHLLDEYLEPLARGHMMQVHLLGWGRKSWALAEIAKKHPWIRSTDSAKPFVYARGGYNLYDYLDDVPPPYPGRPLYYFDEALTKKQRITSNSNINLFQQLAAGKQVL